MEGRMESEEDLERTCIDALIEASDSPYFPLSWDRPVRSSRHSPISSRLPRHSSTIYRQRAALSRPQRTVKPLILPVMTTPWVLQTEVLTPNSTRKQDLQRTKQQLESQSSVCFRKSPKPRAKLVKIADFPASLDRILAGALSSRRHRQSSQIQRKKSTKWSRGVLQPQEDRGTHRDSARRLASPAIVRLAPFKPLQEV